MNSSNNGVNLIKIINIDSKELIYIPINTIKNYRSPNGISKIKLYEFKDNYDFEIKLEFSVNNIAHNRQYLTMNTIILDRKKYLYIPKMKNKLYLVENSSLKTINNSLSKFFENKDFKFLITLDNKNLVATGSLILSFYKYKNFSYKKFFNNINKYEVILGLCKLSNNRFCYLAKNYYEDIKLVLYNEDFSEKEISFKLDKNDRYTKKYLNNEIILLPNDIVLLKDTSKLLLINTDYFEIQTVFQIGEICYILPFNIKNTYEDYFNYFAIIKKENEKYFLKIFDFSIKDFKESENIDINNLLDEDHLNKINSFIDMNYEYNKNGNILFIINFNYLNNEKLSIILEVNLKEIKYI